MNYIGSKHSLLPEIKRMLDENNVPVDGIALDLFAGTGVVARFLKNRGYIVYANDWQYYSYLACVAFIEHNGLPAFESLKDKGIDGCDFKAACVLSYLNRLSGKAGQFYDTYCEGGSAGRQYFSRENGLKIQAIRDQIEAWSNEGSITAKEKGWLVTSLIEGADKVANTASVYGAYLKHIKKTARKPLKLDTPMPVPSTYDASLHKAFCMDSIELLNKLRQKKFRLVYIDPPYNRRQYNANYHILETIARWDLKDFEPRGITGLRRIKENESDFCSKAKASAAFRKLFDCINAEYILFSYNNEGLLTKDEIDSLFRDYCCDIRFEEIPYKRFRADSDGKNRTYKCDDTVEYLVLGRMLGVK